MKNLKLLALGVIGMFLMSGCSATFNAPEVLEDDENRNEIYRNIVSDQDKFEDLLDMAANNEMAKKTLMQNHMQMMNSGKMETMMKKNPEMKEKIKKMMQEKMEKDPEMKKMMGKMMKKRMEEDPEMKEKMMHEMMHSMENNPEMRKKMMQGMMKKMKENPRIMQEMMEKMHDDPEMMERMKAHMDKKKGDMQGHKKGTGKHDH